MYLLFIVHYSSKFTKVYCILEYTPIHLQFFFQVESLKHWQIIHKSPMVVTSLMLNPARISIKSVIILVKNTFKKMISFFIQTCTY